jgi:uncharacterized membrane protein
VELRGTERTLLAHRQGCIAMKDWLIFLSEHAATVFHLMALVVITVGTFEAFLRALRVMLRPSVVGHDIRTVWIKHARWLVGGLTFQLAGDIVETVAVPSWDDIAMLGAVAVIRTFLNFFLERDIAEVHDRNSPQRDG